MPDFSKIGKSNVRRSKAHERRIAKLLKEWSGVEFRRRRVEGREGDTVDIDRTADVIPCVPEWTRFSIEAKCGEWGTFDALMTNPTGTKITEWWHQANYDARIATTAYAKNHPSTDEPIFPVVFFKPHPNFDWIMISKKSVPFLRPKGDATVHGSFSLWFPHMLFDYYEHCGPINCNVAHTKNKKNFQFVELNLDAAIFCRWKDFAEQVDPRSFFIQWPAAVEKEKPS